MKKSALLLLSMLSAFAIQAQAGDLNSCYVVVQDNGLNTILCLSHVGEESLDGSGALLGVFQPYAGHVPQQCWNTMTVVRSATDYAFKKTNEIIRFKFESTEFAKATVQMRNPDGSFSAGRAYRVSSGDQAIVDAKHANMTYQNCK